MTIRKYDIFTEHVIGNRYNRDNSTTSVIFQMSKNALHIRNHLANTAGLSTDYPSIFSTSRQTLLTHLYFDSIVRFTCKLTTVNVAVTAVVQSGWVQHCQQPSLCLSAVRCHNPPSRHLPTSYNVTHYNHWTLLSSGSYNSTINPLTPTVVIWLQL